MRQPKTIILTAIILSMVPIILVFMRNFVGVFTHKKIYSNIRSREYSERDFPSSINNQNEKNIENRPHYFQEEISLKCDGEKFQVPDLDQVKIQLRRWNIGCKEERISKCEIPIADEQENWIPKKYRNFEENYKLALILPFRNQSNIDRCFQLKYFIAYMQWFLKFRNFHIFVIEQEHGEYFNRAYLMNIGSLIASSYGFDYFVFHDVDMIPWSSNNAYQFSSVPIHRARYCDHNRWWRLLFGGITQIPKNIFFEANGFSIAFYSWGGEDDDFRDRIRHVMQKLGYPSSDAYLRLGKDEMIVKCFPHESSHRGRKKNGTKLRKEWEINVITKEMTSTDPRSSITGCGVMDSVYEVNYFVHSPVVSIYNVKLALEKNSARKMCYRYFNRKLWDDIKSNEKTFKFKKEA